MGAFKLVIGDSESSLRAACRQSLPETPETNLASDAGDTDLPPHLEAHWEVVQRIIFIYYKVNRGSSYVQGMNEIVGPIYYVFANHPDPAERSKLTKCDVGYHNYPLLGHAEADTFFCFNNLMTEVHNNFNKHFDQDFGIGKLSSFFGLIKYFFKVVKWNKWSAFCIDSTRSFCGTWRKFT